MKYYITTPIYYVNDVPHIGHAYTSIAADILNRRLKSMGHKTYFLTGTDEHGQKIEKSAFQKKIDPLSFCNEVSASFQRMNEDFNIIPDDFIRTTQKRHIDGVQAFWSKLESNGWIYKGYYKGWYSIRDEAFYGEDELINGKAPTGADVTWHEEESYFFKLSYFAEILQKIYGIEGFVFPDSRLNEVKSFVSSGLKDLSISRTSFKWGIPVPGDEKHVIYVWLDALTNYVTALGYPNGQKYEDFWLSSKTKKIHIIGKDILRFHAVFWPAFLIAERYKIGDIDEGGVLEFFQNFQIVSHGWWKNEGEKMSKSLGNAINPYDITSKFGLDRMRYFFLREVPFGGDGDFAEKRFVETVNSDLANNIGNLTQRVMSFIYVNCDGKIPFIPEDISNEDPLTKEIDDLFKKYEFHKGIEKILSFSSAANKMMDEYAPWNLKKTGDITAMNQCLFTLAQKIFRIYKNIECIMPFTASKALKIFNEKEPVSNNSINKPEPIFLRI